MEAQADTLSPLFGGQWAFVSTQTQSPQARSLPPSSYIPRSSQSSLSRNALNASRSSLPRNIATASVGGRSSISIPSQPVLLRVHSADASNHSLPPTKMVERKPIRTKDDELPDLEEYSIRKILAAIEEDIEEDVNAISEVLGRSRFVLADQHESHLPPTGEIRAIPRPLGAVEEATTSAERLASDETLIVAEDASRVEGSNVGSAAYGLLERLQVIPRVRRTTTDVPSTSMRAGIPQIRHNSSPADVAKSNQRLPDTIPAQTTAKLEKSRSPLSLALGAGGNLTTAAVVSETLLSAGVIPPPSTPNLQQAPNFGLDNSDHEPLLPNRSRHSPQVGSVQPSMTQRLQRLAFWLHVKKEHVDSSTLTAAEHLESVLKRNLDQASDTIDMDRGGGQNHDRRTES